MAVATFDTLKFANTLKAAGVPEKQAEAQAVAFADILQINFKELVTKEDLDHVAKAAKADLDQAVKELRREIADLRDELKREIADLRDELKRQIAALEERLNQSIKDAGHQFDLRFQKQANEAILVRWMLGFLITLTTGIFVRIIFFRFP